LLDSLLQERYIFGWWRSTKSPQQYGWCLVILDDDDTIDVTTTIIVSFDESQYMEEAPNTTN